MKHFLNREMLAPNVLTVPIDAEIVAEFEAMARIAESDPNYCVFRPSWGSDIRWIGAQSEPAFEIFQSAFERLDIARHVQDYLDIDREVRLFAGFLHTRSHCTTTNFHVDWDKTNNEAFTLLTPVVAGGDEVLLYRQLTGAVAEYVYKRGEAIIFGDHFSHSTPVGSWDPPFTMLVFNFGTDKIEHWDKVVKTTGRQCRLIRRPDGVLETLDG